MIMIKIPMWDLRKFISWCGMRTGSVRRRAGDFGAMLLLNALKVLDELSSDFGAFLSGQSAEILFNEVVLASQHHCSELLYRNSH